MEISPGIHHARSPDPGPQPHDWLALSDQAQPVRDAVPQHGAGTEPLSRGALICEVAAPFAPGVVLDLRQGDRVFSLFLDPTAGLEALLRRERVLSRASLPGPLPLAGEVGRLTLGWNRPMNRWALRYERPGQELPPLTASGEGDLALSLDDLDLLCRRPDQALRSPALLWFGATRGAALPHSAPWIGQRMPVATPTGLRPAGQLQRGDMVLTADGRARALRSVRQLDLPSRGWHTPVLLRAPYYSPQRDLLVSPDQKILLTGGAVEYLFDRDEVLAEARHMTDGRAALFDSRRPITRTVSLDTGEADLIAGDGIAFLAADHRQDRPRPAPRPVLQSYEAVPLLRLLGRAGATRLD
ncbi:Hint domain-containing protein [Gemmobacter caeruleus]|uniref:Hint domain-containing protein n=1 Tax=Gemmobacter caeruleus TaxID=2595004 RepID=UPI0011F0365F|nr:Hint domain-containing protein [Gemmobacter caeruleus]